MMRGSGPEGTDDPSMGNHGAFYGLRDDLNHEAEIWNLNGM